MTIRRVVMWIVVFNLFYISECLKKTRTKRSNDENFNVLLNIYKMNPLKSSDTFKNYANRLLLPKLNSKVEPLPDIYSEETTKVAVTAVNFKQIDDIIRLWDKEHVDHSTSTYNKGAAKPEVKKNPTTVTVTVNPSGISNNPYKIGSANAGPNVQNDDMNVFYENFDVRGIGDDFPSTHGIREPVFQQRKKVNIDIKKPTDKSDKKVINLPKAPTKYEPRNLKNQKTEDDYVMIL